MTDTTIAPNKSGHKHNPIPKAYRVLYHLHGGACSFCRVQLSFGTQRAPGYPQAEIVATTPPVLSCPDCQPHIPRSYFPRRPAKPPAPKVKKPPAVSKRRRLYQSFGGVCVYCGEQTTLYTAGWNRATVEHMIPSARGGTNAAENLALACLQCNNLKGMLTVREFYRTLVVFASLAA